LQITIKPLTRSQTIFFNAAILRGLFGKCTNALLERTTIKRLRNMLSCVTNFFLQMFSCWRFSASR